MKLKLTALLLVLYTGLYAQNKIVLTAPRLDTSSLSNRINLKANTNLNNVNGVLSSTYGGAGYVSGILKANGSGTVSAAVAGTDYVAPSALSGYLPLSGGTLTGALNGTSLSMSGAGRMERVQVGTSGTLNTLSGVGQTLQFGNYSAGAFITADPDAYIYKTSSSFGGLSPATLILQTRSDVAGGGVAMVYGSTPTVGFYMNGSGNVGIGTANPSVNSRLAVSNAGANGFEVDVVGASTELRSYNRSTDSYTGLAFTASNLVFTASNFSFNTGAITASSSVTANSFVTTGSVRTTNPSNASYYGLFSNDGAMVFDAYGVGAFSSFKVNGTSVLSVDASGAVINGTSRANGYRFAYSTKSSNYTLTDNDDYINVTSSCTITLPSAVGRSGKRYVIKAVYGGATVNVTIASTSGQTIDGSSAGSYSLTSPSSTLLGILIVYSDGANWFVETWNPGA